MKTILFTLGLAAAFPSFAQSVFVYPQIFNFGNSIQVQINNNTNDNINCSGSIQMHTQMGRMESAFYSDYIRKNGFSNRSFFLMGQPGDRITFTSPFINCYKAP